MSKGYLGIILHAHLPYVHHPEYSDFYEDIWLFQAITECYLPLLSMLERLQVDNISYRLTLSLSPTLMTMWRSPLLQERYVQYMESQIAFADHEIRRHERQPAFQQLARFYAEQFSILLNKYRKSYRCDLLRAFQVHQQSGKLELITTAATHGFLPLLNNDENAVRLQIKTGIDCFSALTGNRPTGFWLPECGFYSGLENILKDYGIEYFFVDSHALLNADPPPRNAVYAPIDCGNGVAAFGRDPASSNQVWSSHDGYPGDADYREYFCAVTPDASPEQSFPEHAKPVSKPSLIKYFRVTGGQQPKKLYDPYQGLQKAKQHAADFIRQRQLQFAKLQSVMEQTPIVVAPYDAELFGHWWFEGPLWLEQVLRLSAEADISCVSCGDYLRQGFARQTVQPAASSWGELGYADYWLNSSNDWIYPLLHQAGVQLQKLCLDLQGKYLSPLQTRAMKQVQRSLLLAQASDWPFILKSGTTTEYAKKSLLDHLARFNYLHQALRKNCIDERILSALEVMDDIFPEINFQNYPDF
jgi:1,4-alpha-glucan branching enzyme